MHLLIISLHHCTEEKGTEHKETIELEGATGWFRSRSRGGGGSIFPGATTSLSDKRLRKRNELAIYW